jgi:hypothetical protein
MTGAKAVSLQRDRASKLYYKLCCMALFFLAAAASFNGFYDKYRLLDVDEFGNLKGRIAFERFVDGTANRPFIYRQMLPNIANLIDRHVSDGTKQRLFTRYVHNGISMGRDPYDSPVLHDPHYFLRYVVVYILVFLFVWAATYGLYAVARASACSRSVSALSAIGFILLVPYFEINAGFFYDYPEIFFFAIATYLALKFRWSFLLPVVAMATWNKESFLLFTPSLYPLLRFRTSRKLATLQTAALFAASLAVYLPVHYYYRNNPGGTIEVHLREQLHSFLQPGLLFHREWNYSLLALAGPNVITFGLGLWTWWRGWPLLPPAIQRHAQIAALINVPLFFLCCAVLELRDLSMLYVPLLLLIAANIQQLTSSSDTATTLVG